MSVEYDLQNNGDNMMNVKNWRVLIVDDVFDNIAIAKAVLEHGGASVETAINGDDGFRTMTSFAPNLILLDLSMPVMDGWVMHEKLRENPDTRSILVIALTAHAMEGDREKVLAAGFDGYISKPFSVRTIIDDIKAIIQSRTVEA